VDRGSEPAAAWRSSWVFPRDMEARGIFTTGRTTIDSLWR
jgi:hypothetical protein